MKIKRIEYSLPQQVVDNEQLATQLGSWSAEQIFKKTGIKNRHKASEYETSLTLAVAACKKLLAEENSDEIDFIIFCTQSPDRLIPPNSTQLQKLLSLDQTIGVLDISHGCSGFVYGLSVASGLMASGQARQVLLVTAETYTKFIAETDRVNLPIFGDAAAAILLEAADNVSPRFTFLTDGTGGKNLIIPDTGIIDFTDKDAAKYEYTIADGLRGLNNLYMNGTEIFAFTLKTVPALIERMLASANMTLEDIDRVVLHQANAFILEHLRLKCGIPKDKFCIQLEDTGNTVSASIPIALKKDFDNGLITSGDTVLVAGFGVGYASAATILNM